MGRTERNGQSGPLRIGGRYRLLEELGTGGMSVVWRGTDDVLGRPVAIKVLAVRLAGDHTFRDRLRHEALAAARLVHPHITAVFDFGETPLDDRLTVPYVVMELNDGESLGARIGRQGSLDWREAVTITAQVAAALSTAHARGLVHRDVTPANVMLTGAGAKVVDFGISAAVGQRDAAADGSLLGTPAYLAPERLAGAQVSAATDVYAIGLLLYRSLTGRLPWPAETTAEALRAHLYAAPEPVPDQPGMPSAVGEIVLRCLTKRPEGRPVAAEVARSLSALVGLQPILPPLTAREPSPLPVRGVARAATRPTSVSLLRLRAGLRIKTALGLGGVRALGGGLFASRRVTRLAAFSLRHRVQALIIMAAVVTVAGFTWSTARETRTVEQAAAGAAPTLDGAACAVRYQLKRDSGSEYDVRLTIVTSAAESWRMQFTYPGSQRLIGSARVVTQKGRRVTVRGRGSQRSFTLHGAYHGVNALPLAFTLDGHHCTAEVLGSVAGARSASPPSSAPSPAPVHPPAPSLASSSPDSLSAAVGRSTQGAAGGPTPTRRPPAFARSATPGPSDPTRSPSPSGASATAASSTASPHPPSSRAASPAP